MTIFQRIIVLSIVLILLSGGTITAISYWVGQAHEEFELQQSAHVEMEKKADHLLTTIENLTDDVHFLASLAMIAGVGIKPAAVWRKPLTNSLSAFMQAHDEILKVRLINVNEIGQELLRINHFADKISVVPITQLQQKNMRPYFHAAEALHYGEVYFSPINLNHDFGKITIPHIPIIRVITPLFIQDKKVGLVSISLRMQPLFDELQAIGFVGNKTYLLNDNGDILLSPNNDLAFAFEFEQQKRLQGQYPALEKILFHDVPISGDITLNNSTHASYLRIFFDPLHSERFLLLVKTYSLSNHAIDELKLSLSGQLVVYIILISLAILLAMQLAKHITKPLNRLHELVQAVANTTQYDKDAESKLQKQSLTEQNDIAGIIASLAIMTGHAYQAQQSLTKKAEVLKHLQHIERMNTQRELQMVALKQEINILHQEVYGTDKYPITHITDLLAQDPDLCLCVQSACSKVLCPKGFGRDACDEAELDCQVNNHNV